MAKSLTERPSNLLLKLSQRLFADAVDREHFVDCLVQPKPFHSAILWCQARPLEHPFTVEPALSWQPSFVDRLSLGQKPGRHPLHDQGAYYCLDFSSVFAASTLLTIAPTIAHVMDVCAAPGGKSLFAWIALRPQILYSNEVIGKRTAALIANLKRCQVHPAIVLRLDSKILAEIMPRSSPVVLVDAPCTGQSLLAKGEKAPGCFHPATINTNANRQKRILANAAKLVAPQGHLAYMTCTYSPDENEQVGEWLLKRFPQFQAIAVPALAAFQSELTDQPCYRLFPQTGLGAGAFTMLFQNTDAGTDQPIPDALLTRPGVTVL